MKSWENVMIPLFNTKKMPWNTSKRNLPLTIMSLPWRDFVTRSQSRDKRRMRRPPLFFRYLCVCEMQSVGTTKAGREGGIIALGSERERDHDGGKNIRSIGGEKNKED